MKNEIKNSATKRVRRTLEDVDDSI